MTMPGLPHVKAELGGMRYIPSQHIMVAGLVDHLKLATTDFPMGAPPAGRRKLQPLLPARQASASARARRSRQGPLQPGLSPSAGSADQPPGPVMNNIYPGMANLSLCDLMKVRRSAGRCGGTASGI